VRSEAWPSRSAVTRYSIVWGGCRTSLGPKILYGKEVPEITSSLEEGGRIGGQPARLLCNSGMSFKGYDLGGDGFQLTRAEAGAMIREDPRNAQVLFRYLNGKDLNSNPTQEGDGWVICFGERSLEDARTFRAPFARIEETVLPVRLESNRKAHRDRWWIYAESRPALTRELSAAKKVIALSAVSRFAVPAMIPIGAIMSSAIVVVPDASFGRLAALTSAAHLSWVLRWGSLMKLDIRYSTSDVFDTFPFPRDLGSLDRVGAMLDGERREIMTRRGLGLTKLYSMVNDAGIGNASDEDVARMRDIHIRLDEAVIEAYGWSDVQLDHGFHTYRQTERWTIGPAARTEILDRLLEENHRRAAAEAAEKPKSATRGREPKALSEGMETLFS
ncbi:MAG: type IIL restriction-modification enzyme MmeI, partial [Silvibacterium sp.]